MHFKYKGHEGPQFNWLNIDYESLKVTSNETGWVCEILLKQDNGNYLARLKKVSS